MFLKQLHIAFNSYISAFQALSKYKLWSMFLWSSLAYLALIVIGILATYTGISSGIDYIVNLPFLKNWSEKYTAVKWLVKILSFGIIASMVIAYLSLFKYIFLALTSPLYAYVSERTASALTGKIFQFDARQLIVDIIRGIKISFRNLIRQTFFTLLLMLLSFIPVIGIICSIIILCMDCFYYGFAMLDYNCERNKMNMAESIKFVNRNKGLALGNGLVFYGMFLIPIIGPMFGAPLSAMAATISLHKEGKL
jgi:CysZ protein